MGFGDYLRDRVDSWRNHPFQNLVGVAAGAAGGPIASEATRRLFNGYNNYSLNHAYNTGNNLINDQLGIDTNRSLNNPLSDPRLSGDNQFGASDPWANGPDPTRGGPDRSVQNQQLSSALNGGGGGMSGGGPSYQGYAGPSMSGQQWLDRTGGYGNIIGQMMGLAPDRGPLVDSLLDPISMGPGLPGSGHMSPGARRDSGFGDFRNSGLYGVSNFMVGGSPVINGANGMDPNGGYLYNKRGVGY